MASRSPSERLLKVVGSIRLLLNHPLLDPDVVAQIEGAP